MFNLHLVPGELSLQDLRRIKNEKNFYKIR